MSASARELPSRFLPPVIGESFAFLSDPATFFLERARELGPVFLTSLFGDNVACFVGPEAFELFLDERHFTRASASPPHVQEIFDPDAVPFLEGAAFERRKTLLMQVFTERAIDGYIPILERVIMRYARRWSELGVFTWVPELTSMGMCAAGCLFLGADPAHDDARFEQAFATALDGLLSVPVKLPFTRFGKALKARDFLRRKVEDAIHEHKKHETSDALSRLMAARTSEGEQMSDDELRIETFHFFGAYVAVIGGLAMLAMRLGRHPEIKDRLRKEIMEKLPDGTPTVAKLRELPYLHRVCKEARRADPVLALTFFANVKEECSFKGVRIPKGIKAVGCIGPTLLDDKTFNEADRFDPDRWLSSRVGERQEKGWVPHGGGGHLTHHRCAGELLAETMMKVFAVLMLRNYDWTLPPQDFKATRAQLFATPASGLPVHLRHLRAGEG